MAEDRHASPPTEAEIAARAYELWELRGRPLTDGDEDWRQAVQELTRPATLPLKKRAFRNLLQRFRRRAA